VSVSRIFVLETYYFKTCCKAIESKIKNGSLPKEKFQGAASGDSPIRVCAFKIKRQREREEAAGGREARARRDTTGEASPRPRKSHPKTNRLHRGVVRYASTVY